MNSVKELARVAAKASRCRHIYAVVLTRLDPTPQTVSAGWGWSRPIVGSRFCLVRRLDQHDEFERVSTSPITTLDLPEGSDVGVFTTQSGSTYLMEIMAKETV